MGLSKIFFLNIFFIQVEVGFDLIFLKNYPKYFGKNEKKKRGINIQYMTYNYNRKKSISKSYRQKKDKKGYQNDF